MENSRASDQCGSRLPYLKSTAFHYQKLEAESPRPWNGEFGFGVGSYRRFAFSRQTSFNESAEPHTPISIISNDSVKPLLSRTVSSTDIPPDVYKQDESDSLWREEKSFLGEGKDSEERLSSLLFVISDFRIMRSGNQQMRSLLGLIFLNMA